MAMAVPQFIDLVRKSNLVDSARFTRFETEQVKFLEESDSTGVAARLVKDRLLTNYQAKKLLTGKYKGFHVGPYKVMEPIGRGGMGLVYLAQHESLGRRVALKVLPSTKSADASMVERFYREGRAAAQLDHPNIVRIHDITKHGDVHYIVMEFVEGETLAHKLERDGPLDPARAVDCVRQTAEGLKHAHAKGFVHRDIKPANLMIDKAGFVKILDMGLTKSVGDDRDNLTRKFDGNAIIGTADIISPEQAMNSRVDHRADIYSLGVTFYMLLTGKPPFEGGVTQKLVAHQIHKAPSLAARPGMPEGLDGVVQRMMAKSPLDRYQTMDEVIDALAPWREGGSVAETRTVRAAVTSTHLTPAPAAETPRKKHFKLVVGIAAAVCLLLGSLWAGGIFAEAKPKPVDDVPVVADRQPVQPAPVPSVPFRMIPLDLLATASTLDKLFLENKDHTIDFDDWGQRTYFGVPYQPIAPMEGKPNIILLKGSLGIVPPTMPEKVIIPVRSSAKAIHFLGGISGWGYPATRQGEKKGTYKGMVSVIVRIVYADGSTEESSWRNGIDLADYFDKVEVPGSRFADSMRGGRRQVRVLTVEPKRDAVIAEIELVKSPDDPMTSPIVFAVTVEGR